MLMVNSVMLSYLIDGSTRSVGQVFFTASSIILLSPSRLCFGTDVNFLSIFLHWKM